MREETSGGEAGPEPVRSVEQFKDPRFVRGIQRTAEAIEAGKVQKKEFNDKVQKFLGDGEVDIDLLEGVQEYRTILNKPYSAKYFLAEEILNDLTKEDFETIDTHILDILKLRKQKTTFEIYNKTLGQLEKLLGLDKDNETMHRIIKIVKFIKDGN
jgi:hypothetical protein